MFKIDSINYFNLIYKTFLLSFFLVRLQPFYIIPFIKNDIFNSYNFSRLFLIIIFIYILFKKNELLKNAFKKHRFFLTILIIFFATQSLSIVNTLNIIYFLKHYKDIIFSYLFFLITIVLANTKNKVFDIVKIIQISILINLINQGIIYFFPDFMKNYISPFLNSKYLEVLEVNQQRGRFFIEFLDFALVPFLFFNFFYQKEKSSIYKKIFFIFLLLILIFFSLISNFRTHVLMVFLSLVLIFYYFSKKNAFLKLILTGVIFTILIFVQFKSYLPTFTLSRFNLYEGENIGTIIGRWKMWSYAIDMFFSNLVLGVGIGNYYDYLPTKEKVVFSVFDWKKKLNDITLTHPHSIFLGVLSETGGLGFLSLLIIVFYFIYQDFIKKENKTKKIFMNFFIISFWSLFLYAIFNPPNNLNFLALFFVFRAIILKLKTINL